MSDLNDGVYVISKISLPVTIFQLAIPGSGLALIGRWQIAALTQLTLICCVLISCYSKSVFTESGLLTTLSIIMIIHFASAVIGFYLAKAALTLKWKQYSIFTLTFFALFSVSVKFRESLLGAGIYFVPSMSMYPTIKPGEFILIDSRAFADRAPMEADIVVFRHSEKSQWLVKRVTQWPENTLTKNKQFFLVGDNKDASFDSRQFGGVPKDSIVGKVELVLLGIDKNFNVVSFLKTID